MYFLIIKKGMGHRQNRNNLEKNQRNERDKYEVDVHPLWIFSATPMQQCKA